MKLNLENTNQGVARKSPAFDANNSSPFLI
jgi:hypothetical protein